MGSIGSPKRQEYTAIGDTINVASRVESLTKSLGQGLLITAATQKQLGQGVPLIPLPPQRVKGKDEPLELFAVPNSNSVADGRDASGRAIPIKPVRKVARPALMLAFPDRADFLFA